MLDLDRKRASEALSPEATVIRLDGTGSDDASSPARAMALLRERGIRSLMVEGGAAVITSFLKAELVDALVLTLSPKLVGLQSVLMNSWAVATGIPQHYVGSFLSGR